MPTAQAGGAGQLRQPDNDYCGDPGQALSDSQEWARFRLRDALLSLVFEDFRESGTTAERTGQLGQPGTRLDNLRQAPGQGSLRGCRWRKRA